MNMTKPTHWIFTDESCKPGSGQEEYSSVCSLSGTIESFNQLKSDILTKMTYPREYHFADMKNPSMKESMLAVTREVLFPAIAEGKIRIDILVWNNKEYQKLEDTMHHHLIRHVLNYRWTLNGNSCLYFPDQDKVKKYETIQKTVNHTSDIRKQADLYLNGLEKLEKEFNLAHPQELDSKDYKLVQITDIFAGVGALSYNHHELYNSWEANTGKPSLFQEFNDEAEEKRKRAGKYNHKFDFMSEIRSDFKRFKFPISFRKGLVTNNPSCGLNFWLWGKDRSAQV